jgi:hypothetical protein
MNPLGAVRRFAPGIALVLALALLAATLGLSLGRGSWLLVVGAGLLVGALAAAGRALWIHRHAPPLAKNKKHAKSGARGPAAAPYDLANDQSTDNQRYLM